MIYSYESVDRDPETQRMPHAENGRAPLRIVDQSAQHAWERLVGYIYRPELVQPILDALNTPAEPLPSEDTPDDTEDPAKDTTSPYPLHVRLAAHEGTAIILSELFDKLRGQGIYFARYREHDFGGEPSLVSAPLNGDDFVGLALDIDPKEFSAEKDRMYRAVVDQVRKKA